ncbi:hypothetical protein VdG2_03818 [Verticillium dahliae VDG2]|nr:hypothetical protein VdG2_03818 [Verticillium dahliae VDG2]
MGSISAEAKLPWIETPLISSPELSRAAGCNILLKLENLQPSGSFKSRGVGNLVLRAVAASASADVHFYCSSGGNAGLAWRAARRWPSATTGALRETLGRGLSDDEWRRKNVVVVVCGGSNVSLEVLEEYKATYAHMV